MMDDLEKTCEKFNIKNVKKNVKELNKLQNKTLKLHRLLLLILKNYSHSIDENNFTKKYYKELNTMLSTIMSNIDASLKILSTIRKLLLKSKSIISSAQDNTINDLEMEEFIQTEKQSAKILEDYEAIEKFVIDNYNLVKNVPKIDASIRDINDDNIDVSSSFVENTLIISEAKNKVFLPYTLEKIQGYITKNKTMTIQDVIDTVYTVPLDNYKNSVISRFTEAFRLIRLKEHGSIKQALDLAFELAFNFKLHPAIITACSNINELDIYLACMEYDELDTFRFFNVVFEVAPTLSSQELFN